MVAIAKTPSRQSLLERPGGMLLVIFILVAVWAAAYRNIDGIILAVIGLLLFLGLKQPVLAIAALIVQQFTIVSYMVPTPFGFNISLQLLLVLLVGLIIWRDCRQSHFDLGARAKYLVLPVLAFIVVAMISDIVNSGFLTAWDDFRNWAVGFMILLFIPLVTKNQNDLKTLAGVAFIMMTVSSTIGILQYFNILGMQSATLNPMLAEMSWNDFRSPGMSESSLELSYLLSTGILTLAGVYLLRGLQPGLKWIAPFILIVIAAALYLTFTRSALISVVIGLIALLFLIKTRINSPLILIGALLISGILIFSPLGSQYLSGRSAKIQEDSAVSRVILWQAGINIALDHPLLGIGIDNFNSVSAGYQSSVDSSLIAYEKREYWDYRTLGTEPPHNDFINIWLSYGSPALVLFLWIIATIINNFTHTFRKSRTAFLKGLSVGLAAALIAYGVNALYHNMLATMPLLWILAGFSLAVSKLVLTKLPARSDCPEE